MVVVHWLSAYLQWLTSLLSWPIWRSPKFKRWLDKRVPPASVFRLTHKNIFILPTRQGFYFLALIFFMMLAGINYQNSLIFALAFMLFSMFLISILHTFRNLSGLTLHSGHTLPVFAGEDAEFTIRLSRQGKRNYEAMVLGWDRELMQNADLLDDDYEVSVKIFVKAKRRGYLNPGRLLVETYYPVGLFRAWSWLDFGFRTLVYPRPIEAGELPLSVAGDNEGELLQKGGVDDFSGMRDYNHGDSLRHIAWKSYARTSDLLVKEFASSVDRRIWLDWEHFQGLDREARLSRLCYWLVQLSKTNDDYGLRLPGVEIPVGSGLAHRDKLLRELAIFELDSRP